MSYHWMSTTNTSTRIVKYTVFDLFCRRLSYIFNPDLYHLCFYLVQGTTSIGDTFSRTLMLLIGFTISGSSFSLLPLPQNVWVGGCVLIMMFRNMQLVSIVLKYFAWSCPPLSTITHGTRNYILNNKIKKSWIKQIFALKIVSADGLAP